MVYKFYPNEAALKKKGKILISVIMAYAFTGVFTFP